MARTFVLTISVDNAAFEDDSELSKILHRVSHLVDETTIDDLVRTNVRDSNGNTVGTFDIARTVG